MKWYTLFKEHILDRGMEYYEDGHILEFHYTDHEIIAQVDGTDIYDVEIILNGKNVADMYCSCPYAQDGHNCKHMAAVLFKFEEMLADEEPENEDEDFTDDDSISPLTDFDAGNQREKAEAAALISKIPEDQVRKILVDLVLADERLKRHLQMQYAFEMNSKFMSELRMEVEQIVYRNSRYGYVDWQHATGFVLELENFLNTKVSLLIEKNCLKQAFELTNLVFQYIGNVDMDDSDGESSFVAEACYECWKQIIEKSDEQFKEQIRKWFKAHREGFVIDFLEDYIEEILLEMFRTKESIEKEIQKLDELIENRQGNDCGIIYSVRYGTENPILKRIEYMRNMHYTDEEIEEYRLSHRRFFAVRELEIREAVENNDDDQAIQLLLESKCLDKDYQEQLKKYSKQLIDIYQKKNAVEEYQEELKYYLKSFWQHDLTYVRLLKASISDTEQWNRIADELIKDHPYEDFVCKLLYEEKRYEELMDKIEQSFNKTGQLDLYEKVLREKMPERVIRIYTDYLWEAAERANDRKKYQYLMSYLKKISKCAGGEAAARNIADIWKRTYKRRTAMMDELRKAGF